MVERDEQGRPTRWVTEVEPEFDANERDAWYALWEYDQEKCPQCGGLRVICSNPEGLYGEGHYPQLDVCWITASQQNASRRFRKLHEKREPDEHGYLPTDGALVWASPENLTPDADWLPDTPDADSDEGGMTDA